jgi:tRNA-dihydrouridine synthase B
VRAVKAAVSIPVLANGDIGSAGEARGVLATTGADGLMIGRAAQGRPWIFREILHFLERGTLLPAPAPRVVVAILLRHLERLYEFYGEHQGVRVARKHVGWYLRALGGADDLRTQVNRAERSTDQMATLSAWFARHEVEIAA